MIKCSEAILSAKTNVSDFDLSVKTVLAVSSEGVGTDGTTLGVGREFAIAKGLDLATNYTGEWTPATGITHTLGAKTELGMIPAVKGVKLNSEVTMSDLETIGYTLGAEFAAPNGVELGIEYVGGSFADDSVKLGTTAKAGIAVKF